MVVGMLSKSSNQGELLGEKYFDMMTIVILATGI